ncbi:MAG: TVP38/TMEM64 family protein [bacterium]
MTYLSGHRFIPSAVSFLRASFDDFGLFAPLIYAVFFGVANSLFVPGFLLAAAAGLLYGPYLGLVVVMIGLILSAQTLYWIGRFGGQSVLSWFSDSTLDLITSYLPRKTGTVICLCRLVFFMPFHAFNAVCGTLEVKWFPYTLGTFVGLFPRMFVYLYIGVSLKPGGNITLAAVFLVLLVVIESLYGALLLQYYLNSARYKEI